MYKILKKMSILFIKNNLNILNILFLLLSVNDAV